MKVTETEALLWKGVELTTHCQERFDGMRSAEHRAAFLSIRHLLMAQGYTDKDLYYDERGKPHLKDGSYISISHSHSFTAVIISHRREVGIDIEKQRDKILRIAHKFTPVAEYRTLANTTALVRKLTWVWGAKESLYKIHARPDSVFSNIFRWTILIWTKTIPRRMSIMKGPRQNMPFS